MNCTVAYTSPFVPAEWIAAHGLEPARLVLDYAKAASNAAGICPFAAAQAQHARGMNSGEAMVFTSTCDQMRRIAEQIDAATDRIFLMNIPATWQTPQAMELYRDELHRLGRFLCGLGGVPYAPQRLADVMQEYDSRRRAQRADGAMMASPGRVPIALVGGPLRKHDGWLSACIEAAGGHVALDATETGHRTLPAPFNRNRIDADPLWELAVAYFGTIPDAFRRPDTLLHDYLRRHIAERGIRGIILIRYIWCDHWHAQLQRIRETTGLPVIEIDLAGPDVGLERTRTRIESLVSILQ